jgi:hypothetical protein
VSALDIKIIRGCVDASEAAGISIASSAGIEAPPPRPIFYPYYWFLFRETVETLLGASSIRISCLVDGRTGLSATSDPFEIELRRVGGGDVLDYSVPEDDALERARRFVRHSPRAARRRALASSRREEVDRSLVYKPFWVVRSGADAPASSLLVDGVTGASCWMNRA